MENSSGVRWPALGPRTPEEYRAPLRPRWSLHTILAHEAERLIRSIAARGRAHEAERLARPIAVSRIQLHERAGASTIAHPPLRKPPEGRTHAAHD